MDRVLHILLILIVIALLSCFIWLLRRYTRPSGRPGLLTLVSYALVGDAGLFALIYAWFGLFSLRDLIFFMAVHGLLITISHLVWRVYTPTRIPYAIAWSRIYLELFYVRWWLFLALLASAVIILPIAGSIVLYVGFIFHVHHADYPSIFAILTLSTGISLISVAVPSAWILMHPALEDSARVRLMLNLYGLAILVFICNLMAGSSGVLRNTEVRLLDAPYHVQISLSSVVIAMIILVVLSIPVFRGTTRQAEEVEELGAFEEDILRTLSRGFRSLSMADKFSFTDKMLAELREHEESFRGQLPPPGYLFRKIYDLVADEDLDTDDLVADRDLDTGAYRDHVPEGDALEALVEADYRKIASHGLLWTTSSAWRDRVTEIQVLGNHMEISRLKTYADRLEELNESPRMLRYALKIGAYGETIVVKRVASFIQDAAKYFDQVESRDFRWRHLFWLQDLIASITIMHAEIDRLQGNIFDRLQGGRRRDKYIKECAAWLDREYELTVRDAQRAREEKRLGGRIIMPFAIPVAMVVVTPIIQNMIHSFRL